VYNETSVLPHAQWPGAWTRQWIFSSRGAPSMLNPKQKAVVMTLLAMVIALDRFS
jgi:hypothetical protein